jgi:hypothetical protein
LSFTTAAALAAAVFVVTFFGVNPKSSSCTPPTPNFACTIRRTPARSGATCNWTVRSCCTSVRQAVFAALVVSAALMKLRNCATSSSRVIVPDWSGNVSVGW